MLLVEIYRVLRQARKKQLVRYALFLPNSGRLLRRHLFSSHVGKIVFLRVGHPDHSASNPRLERGGRFRRRKLVYTFRVDPHSICRVLFGE